jgi:hypothetical protein
MIVRDTIFYVGGGKGGVGKSMVSLTLVQYLIDKYGDSKPIHLIETDESNPDVGRVYKVYASFDREMGAKLFLGYSFGFWAPDRPAILFFSHNLAIMGVYLCLRDILHPEMD